SDLNASMSSIGTAGTSGTIGTMWPSSRSFNLQLEIFFHHLPTIATRSGNDGVRGMGSDPDLVQPLYGRAITRELFHWPISSHLSGDLACYPNRPAPHMEPAAGEIKWDHCYFPFDRIVPQI